LREGRVFSIRGARKKRKNAGEKKKETRFFPRAGCFIVGVTEKGDDISQQQQKREMSRAPVRKGNSTCGRSRWLGRKKGIGARYFQEGSKESARKIQSAKKKGVSISFKEGSQSLEHLTQKGKKCFSPTPRKASSPDTEGKKTRLRPGWEKKKGKCRQPAAEERV